MTDIGQHGLHWHVENTWKMHAGLHLRPGAWWRVWRLDHMMAKHQMLQLSACVSQAFANMVLGNTAVDWTQFGKFVQKGREGERLQRALLHIWERDLVYVWAHDNGYQQWWIDALTVDPSKLVEDEVGIVEAGMEPFIVETDLANAAMGSVPLMQVRGLNTLQSHSIQRLECVHTAPARVGHCTRRRWTIIACRCTLP